MNHNLTNPLYHEFHVYRSHNLTRFAHRKELCPRDLRPLICGWVLQDCWNTAIFTNILYIIYSLSISGLIWPHFHQFCYQPLPHLSVDDSVYHKTIETGNSWLFNYTYCVYCSGGPLSALTCCVNVRLLSAIKKISPLIYSQSWVGSWVYTTQAMMTFTLIF